MGGGWGGQGVWTGSVQQFVSVWTRSHTFMLVRPNTWLKQTGTPKEAFVRAIGETLSPHCIQPTKGRGYVNKG